eukprot:s35_g12.t1
MYNCRATCAPRLQFQCSRGGRSSNWLQVRVEQRNHIHSLVFSRACMGPKRLQGKSKAAEKSRAEWQRLVTQGKR